jgi:hypothetical protein
MQTNFIQIRRLDINKVTNFHRFIIFIFFSVKTNS